MAGWLGWVTEWWMPQVDSPEHRARCRFAVQSWLIAWPAAVLWAAFSAIGGLWWMTALNGLMVLAGPLTLWGLKVTGRLTPWVQITLGCALLIYGPGVLTQTPIDETGLTYAVIVPLVAGLTLGPASALRWAALTSAVTIGAVLLGHAGYSLPVSDPTPMLSKALNLATTMAMTALFAARFSALHRDAVEKAEAASRAKSLFLASISHEIRTPMNGVLGMTEVMLQDEERAESRAQLEVIQRSGRALVGIIDDLLDVTKLEADRVRLEDSSVELAALVTDVLQLFEARARESGLTLRAQVDPALPQWLRADPLRLRQVLLNLVSNAVKFTATGSVELRAARAGERVDFSVTDTGLGIAPEVLPRLFTVFEQADASTTRRFGGTGLGLALSRQLVRLMGGELEVRSTPGQGSTFFFSLPLRAAAPVVRAAPEVGPHGAGRVLVVDDNAINLKVATALVQKAGYDVDAVPSGAQALERARHTSYAAVLMDCHMPEMDGFEATERIRALPAPFGQVPIIALTASVSEEDRFACRRAGMNEVLSKPLSFDALRQLLPRVVTTEVAVPAAAE